MIPLVPFVKTHWLRLILGVSAVYMIFLLNLGTRTMAGHLYRIFTTPEARECGSEIVSTVGSATKSVTHRIGGSFGSISR
jgi:hypothetical protein